MVATVEKPFPFHPSWGFCYSGHCLCLLLPLGTWFYLLFLSEVCKQCLGHVKTKAGTGKICHVLSNSHGMRSFKHNDRREKNCGGERSCQGLLLRVLIKGGFKCGAWFRSVLVSGQASPKWEVFSQENTLLSSSKRFPTINILFSGGNNNSNNIVWMSGVRVFLGAYLCFVFSHPEVNPFALCSGTKLIHKHFIASKTCCCFHHVFYFNDVNCTRSWAWGWQIMKPKLPLTDKNWLLHFLPPFLSGFFCISQQSAVSQPSPENRVDEFLLYSTGQP